MIKYIVYCLDIRTHALEIITIEDDEKAAKNLQNNHSFNLLCELNKKESLYKLELKNNIIQIIEININIQNGWISDKVREIKNPIFEIGIINYTKENFSLSIQESYIPSPNSQPPPTNSVNNINNVNVPKITKVSSKTKISSSISSIKSSVSSIASVSSIGWGDVLNELRNKRVKSE